MKRAHEAQRPQALVRETTRPRARAKVLIVNDDLDFRLKLAALARRAVSSLDADGATLASFEQMPVDALRLYDGMMFMFEFGTAESNAAVLLPLARMRDLAPRMPIFVIARGGDERSAVMAIKMGANDYWPAHGIDAKDLAHALKPLVEIKSESPAPAAMLEGPQIPGFRLIKRISHTHPTTVYLAECADSPVPVALKVQMLGEISADVRQRFFRECELLAGINHRAVADVIDFGATESALYLALEYFPCGSLRDRLRNPMELADAHAYAVQIAEALRVIHEAGIVHRDLKPSNCMLTDSNRLVLIDFGLARSVQAASDITQPNLRVGTPYYVSPEQMAGTAPDGRCDLYSLGVVLFEMLTGALPFHGRSVSEIVAAHHGSPVPRLPKALTAYQEIIDSLLAKKPEERCPSAAFFLEALDRVSESAGIGTGAGASRARSKKDVRKP